MAVEAVCILEAHFSSFFALPFHDSKKRVPSTVGLTESFPVAKLPKPGFELFFFTRA